MACEREEASFLRVEAVLRKEAAWSMWERRVGRSLTECSVAPAKCVEPKESSRMETGLRELRRSASLLERGYTSKEGSGCTKGRVSCKFEDGDGNVSGAV